MGIQRMRWLTVLLVVALVLGLLAGCAPKKPAEPAKPAEPQQPAQPQQPQGLSGSIQIAGSTSVQPLSEELAKAFMTKNPGVTINVAGGGSGAGIKAAQNGTADIGASSRALKPEEKGTVVEHQIATDGIAVVVHPSNKVDGLTLAQVKDIFTGKITNWKQVGGKDAPITVFRREDGSGTLGAFTELVLGEGAKITDKALQQNSNGAMRTAVAGDPNAIGFLSFGYLNNEVKAVKIDGVEANVDNVKAGKYKLSRPFLYLTQKQPEGVVKAYIDFVLSPEGQQIVGKEYITVK